MSEDRDFRERWTQQRAAIAEAGLDKPVGKWTAPADTPRGGAEPRVSDDTLAMLIRHDQFDRRNNTGTVIRLDLRDARATIADLRAKLAEAERERDEARKDCQRSSDHFEIAWRRAEARADAAEAALRKMTEERDRLETDVRVKSLRAAEIAGWKAGRDAAASLAAAEENEPRNGGGWSEGMTDMARQLFHEIRALTPPAETAVEEGQ